MTTRIFVSVDLCYYCNKLSLKTSLDLEKVSLLEIIYLFFIGEKTLLYKREKVRANVGEKGLIM
jgi:hypothetical protein